MTTQDTRPTFIVCEDGDEYVQRFERFLGREFRFVRVQNGIEAERAVAAIGATGLLLDLDFRRLAPEELMDEAGPLAPFSTSEERARCSAAQGMFILRHLRRRGVTLPALLFADLDDPAQVAFLEQSMAPMSVVNSREGLGTLATRLRTLVPLARS